MFNLITHNLVELILTFICPFNLFSEVKYWYYFVVAAHMTQWRLHTKLNANAVFLIDTRAKFELFLLLV